MDQNFGTACSRSVYIKEADKCALGLVIELVKYGKWGLTMTDERAIDLLCEMVTNCEKEIPIGGYVDSLRKEKARALDIAIEAIKEKGRGNTVMDGNVVNHPAHYQLENGMEAIDIIKGTLGDRGYKAFCRGNTLKYLLRAGKKGLITDDLKKAAWYLDAEIKAYEEADDE